MKLTLLKLVSVAIAFLTLTASSFVVAADKPNILII